MDLAKLKAGLKKDFISSSSSEDLQKFDLDGYKFSKKDSTEDSPVFLRK